jgi:hypothetical protein
MMLDTPEITVTSTMATSNARQMTIDPESLKYIISSLTDIYQDGVLACIREYSANARDSHETAGQKRPIEVTLPSAFNPNFQVKDYGLGLNYDDLYKYCGQYGASTKRKSNDTIGAFGLGFKSALTLVPQFSIISVKDGLKHFGTVTRGEDTVGVLDVISTVPTDEPDGFEVNIPAGKGNEFLARANEFFMTWKPGTVLVNGKEPKSFHSDDFEKVGELGYIANSRNSTNRGSSFTVVMGGIGYKLAMSWDLRREMFGDKERPFGYSSIVLNVPLGEVELVPNREALKLTDKTKNAVKKYLANLLEEFSKQVNEKITNAPTRMDALRELENFGFAFNRSETKWKGELIPNHISTAATQYSYSNGRRAKYPMTKANITVSSMAKKDSTIFVETARTSGDNSLALRHIASYAKSKAFQLAKVYVGTLGEEINPWVQEMINAEFVHVVKVEDMIDAAKTYNKENRVVRSASGMPRDTLTYPVAMVTENGISIEPLTATELDALTGKVYYLHEDRSRGDVSSRAFEDYTRSNTIKSVLRVLGKDSKVILVAANRKVSSLESRLKSVKISNVLSALKEQIEKNLKRDFSAHDRLGHYIRSIGSNSVTTAISSLAKAEVKDPIFSTVDEVFKATDNELKLARDDAKLLLSWSNETIDSLFVKEEKLSGAEMYKSLFVHFPLLRIFTNSNHYSFTQDEMSAFVDHFNAVFEAKGAFSL